MMQTPSPWATKADIETLKADIAALHGNLATVHADLRAVQALLTELRDRRPWWRRLFGAAAVVAAVMSLNTAGARAAGAFVDGNRLEGLCESSSVFELRECLGYILGIADAMTADTPINGFTACFPARMATTQTVDVVGRFLAAHLEMRDLGAAGLVAQALAEAFPCK
jgi:hypothetical protein